VTVEELAENIADLPDGTSSGSQQGLSFVQGSYMQILMYNPSTGAGTSGPLPPHLLQKRNALWSPPGDHCAAKAIAVCLVDGKTRENLKQRPAAMVKAIQGLLDNVSDNTSWGYEELDKAAAYLDIRIIVLSSMTFSLLYDTDTQPTTSTPDDDDDDDDDNPPPPAGENPKKRVHLLHDQIGKHFIACLRPNALEHNKTWCAECRKLYFSNTSHSCSAFACRFCKTNHDTKTEFMKHFYGDFGSEHVHVDCANCNKSMPAGCAAVHEPKCKGLHKRCLVCNERFIDASKTKSVRGITEEQHAAVCGLKYRFCVNCDKQCPPDHQCVILPKDFSHKFGTHKRLIVFDLEAMRNEELAGKQEVTVVSAREIPESLEGESKADYTARHLEYHATHEPYTFNTLHDFCVWIAGSKNTTFIAHNMSGYDGVIVHNYLRYELLVKTEVVNVGLKVMYCKWKSCRLIDSLNHMTCSLDGLPKLVGLNVPGIEKTHFPHNLNTPPNREYSGLLPDAKWYDVENTKESPEKFAAWYDSEKVKYTLENPWVLKDVELRYVHQDTLVLAMCMGEYIRLTIEVTGVNPASSVTSAGLCMKVYRHGHIPTEGIPTVSLKASEFAREGFHGGRTEMFTRYYKGHVKLDDVVSMYPAEMEVQDMPHGEPTVYVGVDIPEDWITLCGYARVDFTPPTDKGPYFKPVVGARDGVSGKYEFNLHPKERVVVTLPELRKCVEVGYKITKVHEVHAYTPRNDLFKSYMRTMLKIKLESSAPPDDIPNFIDVYKKRHDIELDPVKLAEPVNDGLRSLAKKKANSLWGKFGQRDHGKDVLVDAEGFHRLVKRHTDSEVEIVGVAVDPFLPNTFSVTYNEKVRVADMTNLKTNVPIAGYVTAWGRLKLYELLGDPTLEGKVLYCDTDSVCFACEPGYKHPLEGNFLGQYEVEGEFDECVFVAAKVYAMRRLTLDGNEVPGSLKLRCKGMRATNKMKEQITFASLRGLMEEEAEPLSVTYTHFRRQARGHIYVGKLTKSLAYNNTTQKSLDLGDDELFIPYGPNAPRLEVRGSKRVATEPSEKLPAVKYARAASCSSGEEGDDDDDYDNVMSESTSERLMREAIAAQDARRNA